MNIIVITGASSGIGREFVLQMDRRFPNIDEFWLIARRKDRLLELSDQLIHNARIFPYDLTKKTDLDKLELELKKNNPEIKILVNAAGYGLLGDFLSADRQATLGMIRLNCEALTDVTSRMLSYMKKGSSIMQMASSAAFVPQENFAVYAATKAYVHSFSLALGQELASAGIHVTSICPGPVDTPFFEIAEKTGSNLAIKKYTTVKPDRVVKRALRDNDLKRKVSVCSIPMQGFRILTKVIPHTLLLKLIHLLMRK